MRYFFNLRRLKQVAAAGVIGLLAFEALILVFGPPDSVGAWLDAVALKPRETPRYIVVLGGGGMPSQSTLIRLYQAAQYGKNLTNTTFIVSLPADNDPETSGVGRMRDELVMRGISPSCVQMETKGRNTREEAVNIGKMLGPEGMKEPLLLVSSDFHLRRATLLFRKVGFTTVSALAAHTVDAEADAGPLVWLRYGLWNNGEKAICMARELVALAACKLVGWI